MIPVCSSLISSPGKQMWRSGLPLASHSPAGSFSAMRCITMIFTVRSGSVVRVASVLRWLEAATSIAALGDTLNEVEHA
jgi:hypothetical protein